jgi:hypothetical protein
LSALFSFPVILKTIAHNLKCARFDDCQESDFSLLKQ